jgi:hypothetical protein
MTLDSPPSRLLAQTVCLHFGLFVPLVLAAVRSSRQQRDYLHWLVYNPWQEPK